MKEPYYQDGTPFSRLDTRTLQFIASNSSRAQCDATNDGVPPDVARDVGVRWARIILSERGAT